MKNRLKIVLAVSIGFFFSLNSYAQYDVYIVNQHTFSIDVDLYYGFLCNWPQNISPQTIPPGITGPIPLIEPLQGYQVMCGAPPTSLSSGYIKIDFCNNDPATAWGIPIPYCIGFGPQSFTSYDWRLSQGTGAIWVQP